MVARRRRVLRTLPVRRGGTIAHQRGLAEAGGGRDEGEPPGEAVIHSVDQATTMDKSGPRRGDVVLGGYDWGRHKSIFRSTVGTRLGPDA